MPTYSFRDENGEEYDILMSWKELDEYQALHPTHERVYYAPNIVSGVSVRDKVGGFREVLSKVAEAHPNSQLANDHGSKSIKQVQTERAVKKWRSKSSNA